MNTHRQIQLRSGGAERRGFTLVELMVAMSLLAMIITALMMTFQQVQRAFRVGSNQVDVLENGRAIMSLISRDLQEMTYAGSTNTFNFYCGVASKLPPPDNGVVPIDLPFGKAGEIMLEEMFFLKRQNDQWSAVKYAFDDKQAGAGVGTLYYKSTNTTYAEVETVAQWPNASEQIGTNWQAYRRIADGVVHFQVHVLDQQGNVITPSMVSNSVGLAVTQISGSTNGFTYACAYTNLPAFVDIELGLLEPQTLKQLEGRLMGVAPADVNNYCHEYLKQKANRIHLFRQRIPIRTQCRIDT